MKKLEDIQGELRGNICHKREAPKSKQNIMSSRKLGTISTRGNTENQCLKSIKSQKWAGLSKQSVFNRYIGREIIGFEQNGQERAEYGKFILGDLSKRLTRQYKRGFDVENGERAHKFYLEYQKDSNEQKSAAPLRKSHSVSNNLSWTSIFNKKDCL